MNGNAQLEKHMRVQMRAELDRNGAEECEYFSTLAQPITARCPMNDVVLMRHSASGSLVVQEAVFFLFPAAREVYATHCPTKHKPQCEGVQFFIENNTRRCQLRLQPATQKPPVSGDDE